MQIAPYKKILSYLIPIKLAKYQSERNRKLELFLYHNRFMLTTPEAIYSNGISYSPFKITFEKLKNELPNIKTFLLLGGGLSSALQILQARYNVYPSSTIVEIDEEIASIHFKLPLYNSTCVELIIDDASNYVTNCNKRFDLIALDVFQDLHVPILMTQPAFFVACKKILTQHGILIINYVEHSKNKFEEIKNEVEKIFKHVETIHHKQNKFFICKN